MGITKIFLTLSICCAASIYAHDIEKNSKNLFVHSGNHGANHKHTHADGDVSLGPHHGAVTDFLNSFDSPIGIVELKLHDDKGDLELWIFSDCNFQIPLDLPGNTKVRVVFLEKNNRSVTMKVRDMMSNKDEQGTPNIRNGKTNYFIFPSSGKEKLLWLADAKFRSKTIVTINANGKKYRSKPFILIPHSH